MGAAPSIPPGTLETDLVDVVAALRQAIGAILAAIPQPSNKAADVARHFGLPRKLGWQIWKVFASEDPLTAIQHLPSPAGFESFLQSARGLGASESILTSARAAASGVDAVVARHADDRSNLDLMIDSLAGERRDTAEEQHRREAYKANTFIFGSTLAVRLVLHVLRAGSEKDRIDVAIVNGLIDLRRTRAEAKRHLLSIGVRDEHKPDSAQRASIVPGVAQAGQPPYLVPYCSAPLPKLIATPSVDGYLDYSMQEWPVGKTGSVTVTTGEVFANFASRLARERDTQANLVAHINRPTEVLIHEVLVEPGLLGTATPRGLVFSELERVTRAHTQRRPDDLLPVTCAVQTIDAVAGTCDDYPELDEMVAYVGEQLNWPLRAFARYRLRLAYPILPSAVIMQFDLPTS
ncbi:MAG: hypothetical protein KGS45_11720 [Planctomycetes bacterium]|nr:hypothetical protein [Planctomycetota bacterium]